MYQVKDGCPGCGICLNLCPVGAIEQGGLGVSISDDCIDCGICVPACPIGLIYEGPVNEEGGVVVDE